ncbi:HSP20-like chaperone [Phlegmacium glaucopus]|nr:HSP20-like chaperone [Phlegmacium glaucopus]
MSVLFYEPFYDIERFFDEAFSGRQESPSENKGQRRIGRGEGDGAPRSHKPRMDLHEDAEKNTVTAIFEFPGLSKDDVQVDVNNGRLSVAAETKKDTQKEEHGYAVRERLYGKFLRTLPLPQGVKEKDIKASMENGVLNIVFPKTTPELAPKKIAIN